MPNRAVRTLMTLALLCGATVADDGAAGAQGESAPPAGRVASLESMRWLAGQWRSEESGQLSEETWSAPHGASMVGMWRLVIDGTPRVIELLTLGVEGDDVVLRLRHFDARLVAREEKSAPLALRRTESGERTAAFRGAGGKGPLTITYRVEGDELVGIVQHGDEAPETYRMRRVAPRGTVDATRDVPRE